MLGCEREADVRVRELAAQSLAARQHDRAVVERGRRERVDSVPARVRRHARIDPEGNETEVRGRELPVARMTSRVAPRAELLEVRDLTHVHLRSQVTQDRLLERLVGSERAAGERPVALERVACPFPEENLELVVPHLEHRGERCVGGELLSAGRLGHEVIDSEAKTSMSHGNGTRSPEVFDLVVVGAGVAGLFAALCAASEGRVLVLAKGPLRSSTSSLAQGGIAAALG